jgi:hypothetical protein
MLFAPLPANTDTAILSKNFPIISHFSRRFFAASLPLNSSKTEKATSNVGQIIRGTAIVIVEQQPAPGTLSSLGSQSP